MRVTTEMMVTSSMRRLSARLERYESAQQRVASGRRINATSDDPSGAARAMSLRASIRARTQEQRNADDAMTALDTTDAQLQDVVSQLQRVQTLVLRAANSAGPGERDAIALELRAAQESLVGMANAETGGRPMFSGFADTPPISGGPGAWADGSDAGQVRRRVTAQDTVVVNRNVTQVFGDVAAGTSVFHDLDALVTAVSTGDAAGIQTGIEAVEQARRRVTDNLAVVGASANRVESARSRTEQGELLLRSELAEVEDVDIAEAIMDLRVEEVAYEATLQALGRALPPSLVTFMR